MTDRQLRVSKIRDGTVIDHLPAGTALSVLGILGIDGSAGEGVSVGMNVRSGRIATKDIVKVEGRELSQEEVDVIAIIAPVATINIIRDYDVVEKTRVETPGAVTGVLRCPNPNCITNEDEPVTTRFAVLDGHLRCHYCRGLIADAAVADLLAVGF